MRAPWLDLPPLTLHVVRVLAPRKIKTIDKRIQGIEASLLSPALSRAQRLQLEAARDEVSCVCVSAFVFARPRGHWGAWMGWKRASEGREGREGKSERGAREQEVDAQ